MITGETGSDPRSYRVDFAAARSALGFDAAWSVRDGAVELHRQYVDAGLTDHDFVNTFVRLAHLRALRESGVIDEDFRRISPNA